MTLVDDGKMGEFKREALLTVSDVLRTVGEFKQL